MPKNYGFGIHIALLFLITLLARPAAAQSVTDYKLSLSTEQSREGYFVVALDQQPQTKLILQQSSEPNFSTIDAEFAWFGDFSQMTLTGFGNGEYFFRLKPTDHVTSNLVHIEVQHYPAWQAYGLFFTGLILFSLLVITLVTLHLRTRPQEVA